MEYVNFKKLDIKVFVKDVKKNGTVVSKQRDLLGVTYFIVEIGKNLIALKPSDFRYLSHNKNV